MPKERRWFALDSCKAAKETAEKIAEEMNMPLAVYPVTEVGTDTDIPITCIIDRTKKEHACFIGYTEGEYESKLRKFLTEH